MRYNKAYCHNQLVGEGKVKIRLFQKGNLHYIE